MSWILNLLFLLFVYLFPTAPVSVIFDKNQMSCKFVGLFLNSALLVCLSLHEFCTVAVITYVDLMSSGLALLILIVYRFFLNFLDVQSYDLQVIVFFLPFQSYSSSPYPSVPLSSVPFHFPCIIVLFMTSSTMLNRRGHSG